MPGLEDTYHWGFVVGPKDEPAEGGRGHRFHAKEVMAVADGELQSKWTFEERTTTLEPDSMLLVRIVVGKITNRGRLQMVFAQTPIRQGQPGWNCVAWVQEAYETAVANGTVLGTTAGDWTKVRDAAMRYVEEKKKAHRFDGQGTYNTKKVPTWDMLQGKDIFA